MRIGRPRGRRPRSGAVPWSVEPNRRVRVGSLRPRAEARLARRGSCRRCAEPSGPHSRPHDGAVVPVVSERSRIRDTSIADAAGDRGDPEHQPEVGGQAQQPRGADEQHAGERPAAPRTATRARERAAAAARAARSARPAGRAPAARAAAGVARRRGSSATTAPPVLGLEGRDDPRPLGVLVEVPAARRPARRGRGRGAVGPRPRRRGACWSTSGAGLGPPGAVDEQPVRRRARQEDRAGVRADVGRRLQVGGDAGGLQHVEQVLADPRVDVAQRAPEDGVQPVVAARPRRAVTALRRRCLGAAAGRSRARGSSRPTRRRSSGRRCPGWPRGSCRSRTTSVVSVLEMPASSTSLLTGSTTWSSRLWKTITGTVTRGRSARVAAHSGRSCIIARVGSLG